MGLIPDIFDEPLELEDGTLVDTVRPRVQGQLSTADEPTFEEAFGHEPPGPGWVYAGELRWVRGLPRKKKDTEGE